MAFQVILAANSIPVPSSYPSQEKLLAHGVADSRLCMGNTDSPACRWVIKGKGHHPNRLHSYTWSTQPILNNLYNLDNANERLLNTCLIISHTIPPWCLTQVWKRSHLVWHIEPSGKRQHKFALLRSNLFRVEYSFCIKCHVGSYEQGPSLKHSEELWEQPLVG